MQDYKQELDCLLETSKEISKEILKIYENEIDVELKEDESPLTKADKISSEILLKNLQRFDYGIISEESEDINPDKEFVWVLDPLDGTKDFIQKTGEFSIMVALLKNKKPVLGFVHLPVLDLTFYGIKGKGAYKIHNNNTRKIHVSDKKELKDYKMVISRNHFRETDKKLAESLSIRNFKKMGSVGIKFGAIAEGHAEFCAYTTSNMGIWDCCPSHTILSEAGGTVIDTTGKEPIYDIKTKKMHNGFIGFSAANKELIKEKIKEYKNDK